MQIQIKVGVGARIKTRSQNRYNRREFVAMATYMRGRYTITTSNGLMTVYGPEITVIGE